MNRLFHRCTALLLAVILAFGSVFAALADGEVVQEFSDQVTLNDIMLAADAGIPVYFWICIDGVWQKLEQSTVALPSDDLTGIHNRYHVTKDVIVEAYSPYVDEIKWAEGGRYFPHMLDNQLHSDGTACIHTAGCEHDVPYDLLALRSTQDAKFDVYYLPNTNEELHGASIDAHTPENTFYTVTLQTTDGTGVTNEPVKYVLQGESISLNLSDLIKAGEDPANYVWTCTAEDGPVISIDPATTSQLTIDAVSQPYTIAAEKKTHTLTFCFDGKKKTITKYVGEKLTSEEFLTVTEILPQDTYPSMYAWNDEEGTNTNPVLFDFTEDKILTADALTKPDTGHVKKLFVHIDYTRQDILDGELIAYNLSGYRAGSTGTETFDKGRKYVPAPLLEKYLRYKYKIGEINYTGGYRPFGHATTLTGDVWFDALQYQGADGIWYIPVNNTAAENYIYFFPYNKNVKNYAPETSDEAKNNSFFTVKVTTVPEDWDNSYKTQSDPVLPSGTLTHTVPCIEGFVWRCHREDGNRVIPGVINTAEDGTKTVTFTIDNVDGPYVIEPVPDDQFTIIYDTTSSLGSLKITNKDALTVEGKAAPYQIVLEDDQALSHKVLDVDTHEAEHSLGGYKSQFYSFTHWEVTYIDANGQTKSAVINPNQTLTQDELKLYADNSNCVSLVAQYSNQNVNRVTHTANFYINLAGQVLDTGTAGSYGTDLFTDCVHSTWISGIGDHPNKQFALFIGTGDNQYATDVDEQIRRCVNTPYKHEHENDDTEYWIQLGRIPEDGVIFERIKAGDKSKLDKLKVNGVQVKPEELTTDNYEIRWYVFKHQTAGDGWHIDGILLPKLGKFVVNKTFVGDADAISAVQANDYHIEVHNEAVTETKDGTTTTVVQAATKQLVLKTTTAAGAGETGYTAYDSTTNTYTWELDVLQKVDYTFTEKNYVLSSEIEDGKSFNTAVRYKLDNVANQSSDWRIYNDDAEIKLTGVAYAADQSKSNWQTVTLENSYIPAGTLAIKKADGYSNNGLGAVKYKVTQLHEDNTETDVTLYKIPGLYSYNSKESGAYSDEVGSILTTGPNGNFSLQLEEGKYKLTEEPNTGYQGAEPIEMQITVDETGKTTFTVTGDELVDQSNLSSSSLILKNKSVETSVTVQKDWGDDTPAVDEVTVELYMNGKKVEPNGSLTENPFTLTSKDNWQKTFTGLPLYLDGQPAVYTLRETKIGTQEALLSVYPKDGYADYDVTYAEPVYRSKTGEQQLDPTANNAATWEENGQTKYADDLLLQVSNRPFVHQFTLAKTDENGQPIPGVQFSIKEGNDKLYFVKQSSGGQQVYLRTDRSEPGATTTLETHQTSGTLVVEGLSTDKTYSFVLEETGIPQGYDSTRSWPVTIVLNKETNGLQSIAVQLPEDVDDYASLDGNGNMKIVNHEGGAALSLSKTVQSFGSDNGSNQAFTFTITRENKGLTDGVVYDYLLYASADDTAGTQHTATVANGAINITLENGQRVKFEGMPLGEKYRITENKLSGGTYFLDHVESMLQKDDGSTTQQENRKAYTVTSPEIANGDTWQVDYYNGINPPVDTGLTLDEIPYVLLMATAMAGLMMLLRKRRREQGGAE